MQKRIVRKGGRGLFDTAADVFHGHRDPDNPRRGGNHQSGIDPKSGPNLPAHHFGVAHSSSAGARVGVAAVDDHRLDESTPHPPHPYEHGRGLDPVGGEKRRGCGRPFRKDQGEILFLALLDAAGNAGKLKAGNSYATRSHWLLVNSYSSLVNGPNLPTY